ncbi:hypothetical protein DFH11DRAFT_1623710 [Phellopilus nigrolimitatus]|nr:hypothetical protein DFH11DRAFT_1623710 [Phellopilus nigrolimitatus]
MACSGARRAESTTSSTLGREGLESSERACLYFLIPFLRVAFFLFFVFLFLFTPLTLGAELGLALGARSMARTTSQCCISGVYCFLITGNTCTVSPLRTCHYKSTPLFVVRRARAVRCPMPMPMQDRRAPERGRLRARGLVPTSSASYKVRCSSA